jgi:hypothetical protein
MQLDTCFSTLQVLFHQQETVRHFTPFSIQMPNTQVVIAPASGSENLKL